MNLNKVMLIGNLTRDPELKYTPNGTAVAEFGIAVNRNYKQGEEWKKDVCYIDIAVWNRQAENCAEFLKKGSQAFIEGRLRYNTWESDGRKRSKLDVVADNVLFLSRTKGDSSKKGEDNRELKENEAQKEESIENDEPPF